MDQFGYVLTASENVVLRLRDSAFIPNDPLNADWQDYQSWLGEGNAPEPYVLTYEQLADRVNAERDRRMATFVFSSKAYDLMGQSLANVSGAGTLSLAAIINGAQPGDLRWADPDQDFTWIANDNTIVPMDAQTTWAFAQTAAAWRKHCIYKARALKDMNPIPSDYTSDSYWT